jgi:hypothetical protein
MLGQLPPRWSVHARRYLYDKAFGYLKRVIVTPAVYKSLLPLDRVLTDLHWAGFTFCTQPFGLAESYVCI